jgi:hypothetical protein
MLNVVFGWCERFLKRNEGNQESCVKNCYSHYPLSYWEVLWFDTSVKSMKQNIFEIVKAADFYDISPLITSLSMYIGKEFQNKKNDFIHKQLYVNSIYLPFQFAESVLYQILVQKQEWDIMQTNFVTKRVINPILTIENCANVINKKILSFKDFMFLKSLHGNHIRYDHENECTKNDMLYKDVSLNINQTKNVRRIMEFYLLFEELNTAIVAGGIFWEYIGDSLFAKSFPQIYKTVVEKKDIDIFILDDSHKNKYLYYYGAIFEPMWNAEKNKTNHLENKRKKNYEIDFSIQESDKIYDGVDSFKIRHYDGQIVNFIFVSGDSYASTVLFLETFDFSVSKTYYSYEMDALYLPIEIFAQTERMCSKFQKKISSVDVDTIVSQKFQIYYDALVELCEFKVDQYGWVAFVNLSNKHRFGQNEINNAKEKYIFRRKTIFMIENRHKLRFLSGCGKLLYRIFKYGFKNNFRTNEECESALTKVKFFYKVLKSEIDENCFNSEHMTDSIFKFLLE